MPGTQGGVSGRHWTYADGEPRTPEGTRRTRMDVDGRPTERHGDGWSPATPG